MKKALTIRIDEELLQRMRLVVYWTHGMSLTDFCQLAFEREVERLEKLHKGGKQMFKGNELTPIKLKRGKKIDFDKLMKLGETILFNGESFERSSGNIFKDLGFPNAEEKLREAEEYFEKEQKKRKKLPMVEE